MLGKAETVPSRFVVTLRVVPLIYFILLPEKVVQYPVINLSPFKPVQMDSVFCIGTSMEKEKQPLRARNLI